MSRSSLQTVCVVIPCYNAARTLPQALMALNSQTVPLPQFEVIVVDDGSTDGSQETVNRLNLSYDCRVLQQQNRGAAAARNVGAIATQADVLLFMDADIVASRQLLAEHLAAHRAHRRALVVGRVDPLPEMQLVDTANWVEYELGDTRVTYLSNRPNGPDNVEIPYYDGWSNNLSVERVDFEQIGGFDETFCPGAGYEDVEFSFRATQCGLSVFFRPVAQGYHDHPRSLADHLRRSRSYIRWGNYLLAKHPELQGRVPSLKPLEPVRWKEDRASLILSKMKHRFWAWFPVRGLLEVTLKAMQNRWANTHLAKILYWRLIKGYAYLGFQEGVKATS